MALFRSNIQGGLPYTKCTIVGSLRCRGIATWTTTAQDKVAKNQTSTVTIVINLTDGSYTISGGEISRALSSAGGTSGSAAVYAGSSGYFRITSITFS